MTGHQFSGNIFGLAKVGQVFLIVGTSSAAADRLDNRILITNKTGFEYKLYSCFLSFDISLKNGKHDGANVPLHLSVRFRDNIIVRNSLINQVWGAEEREQNLDAKASRMPLVAGKNK